MDVKTVRSVGWTKRSVAASIVAAMDEHQRQIGQRVAELREKRDWGQPELSQHSGVSIKTISRIENGHVEGRRDTLRAIAAALGISRAELEGSPPAPLGLGAELPELATHEDVDRLEAKVDAALVLLRRLEAVALQEPPGGLGQIARGSEPTPPHHEQEHSPEEEDDQRDTG